MIAAKRALSLTLLAASLHSNAKDNNEHINSNQQQADKARTIKPVSEAVRTNNDWTKNIRISGLVQADARYFNGDNIASVDTFLIRRARINVQGKVTDDISFRIMPEFSDGNDGRLLDAYIDWKTGSNSSWRVGKFKLPIGLERVRSAANQAFIEHGLTDNLVPNRDVGVAWNFKDKHNQLTVGIGNNAGDRQDTAIDTDDGKALFARAYWQPKALAGLGIGLAGSINNASQNTSLPNYRTSSRATVFRFTNGVLRDGTESRIAPHFTWFSGSMGAFGEYIVSKTELNNNLGQRAALRNSSWQLVGSWLLSGEQNNWSGITPAAANGAWELVARIAALDIDDDVFVFHSDLNTSVSKADAVAIGLNWHANRRVKVLVNYEITRFTGGAANDDREDEKLLSARLQLTY